MKGITLLLLLALVAVATAAEVQEHLEAEAKREYVENLELFLNSFFM
jgi:hypothetical protein